MFDVQSKEINGIQFQVRPFFVAEALKIKAYLARVFAPALGGALGALDAIPTSMSGISGLKLDGANLASSLQLLMGQLGEDQFYDLLRRLMSLTTGIANVNGKAVTMSFGGTNFDNALNNIFVGKIFTIYPLLMFILEVNYPDFFGQIMGVIGNLRKTLTSQPVAESETNSQSDLETSEP